MSLSYSAGKRSSSHGASIQEENTECESGGAGSGQERSQLAVVRPGIHRDSFIRLSHLHRLAGEAGGRMHGWQRLRPGFEQPLVDSVRHADLLMGFAYLCVTGGHRLEQSGRFTVEGRLARLAFWAVLQSLSPLCFVHCARLRLPLLSNFARAHDAHLHHGHLAATGKPAQLRLGAMVGQDCRRRSDCRARAAPLLRRLLGQGSRAGRSMGARPGRVFDKDERQVLRRLLVPALRRTERIIRRFGKAAPLRGVQPQRPFGTASDRVQRERHQELPHLGYQWHALLGYVELRYFGAAQQSQISSGGKPMKRAGLNRTNFLAAAFIAAMFSFYPSAPADPSRYPEFAQQSLPANLALSFISIDELVEDVKAGKKPLIIDVRSEEEYREAHILGAQSAPLAEFKAYLRSVPRDRPVVLY